MAQTVPAGKELPPIEGAVPEKISGGHLVAKQLKTEGVDAIFTICGGHIIDIYDGCIDEGIKIIDVRHEQVAAHAADGYARLTGRLGCAVVTAGPGTTNTMTGVANAFRAESPMLLIGGQAALTQRHMGGLQDLPHVDFMRPVTKFASSVPNTERIGDFIATAARESFNGAFGPSYLEIPRDVLDLKIDPAKAVLPKGAGFSRASTKSIGDPADIEKLADLLVHAKKPAILLGQQVWTCRGSEIARAFVEKLNIPAYMNGAGRGTLAPDHALGFQLTRRDAFGEADVIVVVGTPFDFRLGYGKSLRAKTVVQIDMGYTTVGRNRDIQLGMVGDVGAILAAVLQATSGRNDNGAAARNEWVASLRAKENAAIEKRLPRLRTDKSPISPYRLAYEIDQFLTDNTIFIGDGGDVVTVAGNVVKPKAPGLWMDPGPLGTLGVGTGFAMAAKLTQPQREVVVLFGDGSFAMTGFDIQTAMRFNLPYIAIVGNNQYMNQIRIGQIQKYGKERGDIGNFLGEVHFEKFADMLGIHGEAVREAKEIRPALERARASGTCAIVNVWLDPDEAAPGTENQTMYK